MIFIFLNIAIMIFFCIYWCINEKIGLQLCIVVLLSTWTIHFLYSLRIDFLMKIHFEWFVISLLFCGYIFLRKIIEALLVKGGFRVQMIVTAAVSFLLIIYHPNLYFVISSGILLGLGLGYCLNKKFVGFNAVNSLQRTGIKKYLTLIARLALGILILLLIVYRVEIILKIRENPTVINGNQNIFLYGFLCYTLIGFWVTIAAPWLFMKLQLAGTITESTETKTEKKSEHRYGSHWFQG